MHIRDVSATVFQMSMMLLGKSCACQCIPFTLDTVPTLLKAPAAILQQQLVTIFTNTGTSTTRWCLRVPRRSMCMCTTRRALSCTAWRTWGTSTGSPSSRTTSYLCLPWVKGCGMCVYGSIVFWEEMWRGGAGPKLQYKTRRTFKCCIKRIEIVTTLDSILFIASWMLLALPD